MSKELKYVLIAAAILAAIAGVIVMRTNSVNTETEQPLLVEEEEELEADSTTTDVDTLKGAFAANEQEEENEKVEEEEAPVKKEETSAKKEEMKASKTVTVAPAPEKPVRNNEKPAKSAVKSTAPVTSSADHYAVQTAALSSAAAAKAAEAKLQAKGFSRAKSVNKGGRYIVYAGTFPDEKSAMNLKKQLDRMSIESFVKRIN